MGRRAKKNTRTPRVLQKLLYLRKLKVRGLVLTSTQVLTIIVEQLPAYLHLPHLEAVIKDQPPIQAHNTSEQKLKPFIFLKSDLH